MRETNDLASDTILLVGERERSQKRRVRGGLEVQALLCLGSDKGAKLVLGERPASRSEPFSVFRFRLPGQLVSDTLYLANTPEDEPSKGHIFVVHCCTPHTK